MGTLIFIGLSIFTGIYGQSFKDNQYKFTPESVKYSLELPTQRFELKNTDTDEVISYAPNTTPASGLSLSYEKFGIGASFKSRQSEEDKADEIERSDYFNYFLRFPYLNGVIDIFYGQYNGFKLEAIDDKRLLDINSTSYGFLYKKYLDESFNIKKSTGDFSLGRESDYGTYLSLGYARTKLNSSETLVPNGFESQFEEYIGLQGLEQDTILLLYGASGQYTKRSFYAQASLAFGINLSRISYSGADIDDSTKTGPSAQYQINLGYEFQNSLLGFEVQSTSFSDIQNENQFRAERVNLTIYYHYFFKS